MYSNHSPVSERKSELRIHTFENARITLTGGRSQIRKKAVNLMQSVNTIVVRPLVVKI